MNLNLALPLYRNSLAHPEQLALSAQGVKFTYFELARFARNIAGALLSASVKPGGRVAILASRSIEACAGTLGACWTGATYVPISLELPEERLISVLESAKPDALIADARGAQLVTDRVVGACPDLILKPAESKIAAKPSQQIGALSALAPVDDILEPIFVRAEDIAYIIFTSGTTGISKGVMISAGNLHHYLSVMQDRYRLMPQDRVAGTAEWSFDLSVSNMFLTWSAGASLHVIPSAQVMAPAKFISDNSMTVWFSVPSIIALMKRMKALRPGLLPSLRYSLFAGEGVPLPSAKAGRRRRRTASSIASTVRPKQPSGVPEFALPIDRW